MPFKRRLSWTLSFPFFLDGAKDATEGALENMPQVYYGVVATDDKPFSTNDKDAVTSNMRVTGQVKNGLINLAHPEDAIRHLAVQRMW